jgi:hypothetical protein
MAARADTLTLTLDSPYRNGPSTLFSFTGTMVYTGSDAVNNGGVTEYLTGDFNHADSPAVLDDGSFNLDAPSSMNPGGAWPTMERSRTRAVILLPTLRINWPQRISTSQWG